MVRDVLLCAGGLDTQRGLVGARVLLLGSNGLANEIAKNLVLAGIGHVCIQDAHVVENADLAVGGLFSVSEAQLGQGKAEALAEQLQPMNPSVDLVATRAKVSELDAEMLGTYQFIIGTRGVDALREVSECTALLERRFAAEESSEPAAKRSRSAMRRGAGSSHRGHVAVAKPCPWGRPNMAKRKGRDARVVRMVVRERPRHTSEYGFNAYMTAPLNLQRPSSVF